MTIKAIDQRNSVRGGLGVVVQKRILQQLILLFFSVVLISATGCDPKAPAAPLKITFRSSAINGLVLQVQNASEQHLSCKMCAVNKVYAQSKTYSFTLSPYKNTEIGILEAGWAFQHGEQVMIETEGYEALKFAVP